MDRARARRGVLLSPRALGAGLLLTALALATAPPGVAEEPPAEAAEQAPAVRRVGRVRMEDVLPGVSPDKPGRRGPGRRPLGGVKDLRKDPAFQDAVRALENNRPRIALRAVSAGLESDPDDLRLYPILAAAWGGLGHHVEALSLFELVPGGASYEALGLAPHADALRAVGRGAEAAALRGSVRATTLEEGQELLLLLEIADDHMAAGDHGAAEDALMEALALYPRSSSVHAGLALALQGQGRDDEAGFHLWFAHQIPGALSYRARMIEAHILIQEDLLEAAGKLATSASRIRRRSAEAAALRAELMVREGNATAALSMLASSTWEGTGHPELKAVEALALGALGEADAARGALDEALALYPAHPDLLAARAALQGPAPRDP